MKLIPSLLRGTLGFAVVSTAAFAVWAFGAGWFHHHGGEGAMYAACCLVFVALAGPLLHPLVAGPRPLARFYGVFIPAFVVYAVAWCAGYFTCGSGAGEWVASAAGSLAFAAVAALLLGKGRGLLMAALVTFAGHSAGYFAGEKICYQSHHSMNSELVWGLCYGLGFGLGIGYTFWAAQSHARR
jgi:hypothetical protein